MALLDYDDLEISAAPVEHNGSCPISHGSPFCHVLRIVRNRVSDCDFQVCIQSAELPSPQVHVSKNHWSRRVSMTHEL